LLFFGFTLTLTRLVVPEMPRRDRSGSFAAESWEGVRYMATHPGIRMQMIILFAVAFFARPLTDLFPGFAAQVFEGGPDTLASMMSAMGLGAVGGGVALALRSGGTRGMTAVTLGSMALAALTLLAFSFTGALWQALPLLAVLGFSLIVQGIGNQTLIQSAADSRIRGRVISLYGMARGAPSLGALVMGTVAESAGLRPPVAVGAVICLLVWAWAWRRRGDYASHLETPPV
jgi:MFS family permease